MQSRNAYHRDLKLAPDGLIITTQMVPCSGLFFILTKKKTPEEGTICVVIISPKEGATWQWYADPPIGWLLCQRLHIAVLVGVPVGHGQVITVLFNLFVTFVHLLHAFCTMYI